jgi:endo-1,4-beta-xylanase
MNEAGLHWTIWNYRDPPAPGFGLYFGDDLDERLDEILRQGLNGVRVYLPLIASPEGGEPSCPAENTLRALACRRSFYIGSAAVAYLLPEEPEYAQTLAREFNMTTAEYVMKFAPIHPEPDVYDFQWSDLFMEFAEQNNMLIRGHTLLWYVEDPDWVKQGDWTREELIEVMREHIYTVMGHYQNRIYAWDVVNEGVYDEDDVYEAGSAHLRANKWLEVIGGDYMDLAFQFAREADPNARLFYNDYGGEGLGAKSDAIYNLLKDMRSRGVPVDGVGLQMHVSLEYLEDYPSQSDLRANIRRLADLGLIVHITELDVAIRKPVTPEKLEQQAEIYRSILEVCLGEPACEAVVVWGFTDKHSWIPDYFPNFDAACLFDSLYQPKPAYLAVQQVLANP